ncbi:MAG: hypothetical protein DRN14_08025 [Thermoplasmata archaeon]|nr:MAG: hypothetical protein DRN14_08025 [Thermoplasmata archaeon]
MNYKEAIFLVMEECFPVMIALVVATTVIFTASEVFRAVRAEDEMLLYALKHGQAKLGKNGEIEIIPDITRQKKGAP